jgi:CheY-like chemotaxis protein
MGPALLRPLAPGPHGQRLLDTMEKSAARCVALVRQLLAFARGASGEHQLLQARHILRELQELAEMTFPKLIRVTVDLPANLWPIQANATQIHQVFLNLCVNARDAMPLGGVLTLSAANCTLDVTAATHIPEGRPGHFLAVVVRDTGTGIPPEVLPRIWEPFFTTKAIGVGTGLGLSTVRGILRQHDAFVTVETSAAHGTAFTVYLPAADEAPDGETRAPLAVPAPGQGELILVVDDEAPVRQIAIDTLQAHGYRTLTAADGAEAIATYAQHQAEVRLLLTDMQMPVLGGEALLAVVLRLQPLLPVVVMSGLEAASHPADAAPGPAFLAKPFRAETLLALVRLTLDRAQAGAKEGETG